MRSGDILTAITWEDKENAEPCPIDMQWTSSFSTIWSDRIAFSSRLDRMQIGDKVTLHYKRHGDPEERQIIHHLQGPQNICRYYYPDADFIDYMVIAGVFVMPYTINHHLQSLGGSLLSCFSSGNTTSIISRCHAYSVMFALQ